MFCYIQTSLDMYSTIITEELGQLRTTSSLVWRSQISPAGTVSTYSYPHFRQALVHICLGLPYHRPTKVDIY